MKKQKSGFLSSLFGRDATQQFTNDAKSIASVDESQAVMLGAMPSSVSSMFPVGKKAARERAMIYQKWAEMEADPFVSTAMWLQTTAALGGHETTGEVVFVEAKSGIDDKNRLKLVDDIIAQLSPIFNEIAFTVAYTGASFGDAYARVYAQKGVGVTDVYCDELVRPPLVQPFEQGSRTVGYAIATGKDQFQRLTVGQMARLKMPRVTWVPQTGVYQKSQLDNIVEDDTSEHELMPSAAGGSLLYSAEDSYDQLKAALAGLVGQRWLDLIDEQIVTVDMSGMNDAQQKKTTEALVSMWKRSKERAEESVSSGQPFLQKVKTIFPVWGDKKLQTVTPANGGQSGRNGDISIDDVLFHAKAMAGALGTDLSMIGFADQLSGGLGEGGFFRVSAQSAERARITRIALTNFFNQIVDIHTYNKYGFVIADNERPYKITFYSTISALAAEQARTQMDSATASQIILQGIQMLRDMGADVDTAASFLRDEMQVDEEKAKVYAKLVEKPAGEEGDGGMF